MSDKMTEISKQQAVIIRELMKTVLEPALLEKGLKIQRLGNATYDGDSITFKGLSIALLDAPKPHEKALQNELEARRTHKDIEGLYGAVLDQSKIANLPKLGKVVLVGYNPKARKRPFMIEQLSSKKVYDLTTEGAEQLFKA